MAEVVMPRLSDSMEEGTILQWLKQVGDEVELLHDMHERVEPRDAIRLLKELERYRPFFIEDPVAPEANDYFRQIRAATTVRAVRTPIPAATAVRTRRRATTATASPPRRA